MCDIGDNSQDWEWNLVSLWPASSLALVTTSPSFMVLTPLQSMWLEWDFPSQGSFPMIMEIVM